jgi:hypothetical protein
LSANCAAQWDQTAEEVEYSAGLLALVSGPGVAATNPFFGIQVLDDQTGRGVPLVELETVNHLRLVTDSAGGVAFAEPGFSAVARRSWGRSGTPRRAR